MQNDRSHRAISRRHFAKTVAGGALVVGFNTVAGTWVTSAQAAPDQPLKNVPPLDGTLYIDDATRAEYAQDYGQIVHETPLAVLKPGSVRDIQRMVQYARRYGIRIAARGQGHLPFGQAQVESGLVIDLRSLNTVHRISADRIEVDAGIQWRVLVQATFSKGLTPPILTSFLGLTVGGTLSIGGISPSTYRDGAQVDHVYELQVVTGEGKLITCSDRHNRDLFNAVLAGQGQCGIITRATVRLIAAPTTIREYFLPYPDLPTLIADGTRLIANGRFTGFSAFLVPAAGGTWRFFLNPTVAFNAPDQPDDATLLAGLGFVPGAAQIGDADYLAFVDSIPDLQFKQSRPDLSLLLPGSSALAFIDNALPRLTPDDLGTGDVIQVFFWPRDPFTRPLFRVPAENTMIGFVILRTQTTDPAVVDRMVAGNRTLFDQNRAVGGTHYPFSALDLDRRDWKQHYGAAWNELVAAKRRFDPDNVLASGPDIFS